MASTELIKTGVALVGYGVGCGVMNCVGTSIALKSADKKYMKEVAKHPEYTEEQCKALYNSIAEDKRATARVATSIIGVGAGIGVAYYVNSQLNIDEYDKIPETTTETVDGVEITTF